MIISSMQTALLLLRQDQPASDAEGVGAFKGPLTSNARPVAQAISSSDPADAKAHSPKPPKPDDFPVRDADQIRLNFKSKVVVSTTLALAYDAQWKAALDKAGDRLGSVVTFVIMANSKFHVLDQIDPAQRGIDAMTGIFANSWINTANATREEHSYHATPSVQSEAEKQDLAPYLTQTETGEFKISPFQIKTDDGKLVAEFKENGHFLLYNEDGSLLRDMNRAAVCSELTPGSCLFARMASYVYSDDKDLQLY